MVLGEPAGSVSVRRRIGFLGEDENSYCVGIASSKDIAIEKGQAEGTCQSFPHLDEPPPGSINWAAKCSYSISAPLRAPIASAGKLQISAVEVVSVLEGGNATTVSPLQGEKD